MRYLSNHRNIDAVRTLIDFGADVNLKCQGMPCTHLALFTSIQPGGEEFGFECFKLLLNHGASMSAKVIFITLLVDVYQSTCRDHFAAQ